MATVRVELSAQQIVDAYRQLPPNERKYVVDQFIAEIGDLPRGEKALGRFDDLRDSFRLRPEKESRLSTLLAKANEAPLAAGEQEELDGLLHESQERTLQLTLAMMTSGQQFPVGPNPF